MPRPTILVVEPEPFEALSARKLVLESAKFNVLTAHSTQEALDLFEMFPQLSAVVLVMEPAIDLKRVIDAVRTNVLKVPVVALATRPRQKCKDADHCLSSNEPEELLTLLRRLMGDPRRSENHKLRRAI
jgi:CheY-like chemotaxis protein